MALLSKISAIVTFVILLVIYMLLVNGAELVQQPLGGGHTYANKDSCLWALEQSKFYASRASDYVGMGRTNDIVAQTSIAYSQYYIACRRSLEVK